MLYIGIDPGANGGIAALAQDGEIKQLTKMPPTPQDLLDTLAQYSNQPARCLLERVGGMPGNGGSAMFHFGQGFGHLEMALLALKIPTLDITPRKWQKHYQLGTASQHTKTEWKNILKRKAQQLFPSNAKQITLATADALLIAEYLRATDGTRE